MPESDPLAPASSWFPLGSPHEYWTKSSDQPGVAGSVQWPPDARTAAVYDVLAPVLDNAPVKWRK